MRTNKPWMIWLKGPVWEAAGEGIGGGEGEGEGAPAAFDWGEVDDDLRGFIADKDPLTVAREGLAHQRGATQRHEKIVEGLKADENFIKDFSEKNGFIKAPADDDQFIEFAKSRIGEDAEYKHPKIEGANEGMLDMWAAAAREAGLPPGQYSAFVSKAAETLQAAAADGAAKVHEDLKAQWGDDFAEKNVHIDNFMRAVGDEGGKTMTQILSMFPPELQVGAANVLSHLGSQIGSAEKSGDMPNFGGKSDGGAAMSWDDARKMLSDVDNDISKLSGDERAQYDAAFASYKASKGK